MWSATRSATVFSGSTLWHTTLVGLLDGKRTVDEVWRLTLERYGDMAPTQNEVIGLLGPAQPIQLIAC